jgi:hypothetical protein
MEPATVTSAFVPYLALIPIDVCGSEDRLFPIRVTFLLVINEC